MKENPIIAYEIDGGYHYAETGKLNKNFLNGFLNDQLENYYLKNVAKIEVVRIPFLQTTIKKDKLEKCMTLRNPLDSHRRFDTGFKPDPDKVYYIHADLAQKHDHCAVAMSHVDKWVNVKIVKDYEQISPVVIVDADIFFLA